MKERILNIINAFHNGKKIAFATNIGVTSGNVGDWISGKSNPSARVQRLICEKYGISLEWLQDGKGEMLITKPSIGGPEAVGAVRVYQIPVLGKVAAGFPLEIMPSEILEYISVPDVPKNSYALRVKGDSMRPTLWEGDYVIFQATSQAESGKVVIVNDDYGQTMVKRYFKEANGFVTIKSDNPEYDIMKPNGNWKIVGVVVEVVRKFRV